jgi:predicted DNA-binding protein (MmcQ/YjbR family)
VAKDNAALCDYVRESHRLAGLNLTKVMRERLKL